MPAADVYRKGKLAGHLNRAIPGALPSPTMRRRAGRPAGETPIEPGPLADTTDPSHLDFGALPEAGDLHALPGVQP